MSANPLIGEPAPQNLLGLDASQLAGFFAAWGEKPFRARQLMRWLYRNGEIDFDAMTDLSLDLRSRLKDGARTTLPPVVDRKKSSDGTRKWLVGVGAGQVVETVFIPEPSRGTLCISSQAGCLLDCTFCATAQQGFNRNLSAAEIIGQVMIASRELSQELNAPPITNVVFMGMGEPLANYRSVVPVVRLLIDDLAYGLSRRRVTISTAGLVPQIYKLAEDANVALAVSLHAPSDDLRDELVPINRRYPLQELLEACWHYADAQNSRSITFEYVMLRGVNDHPEQARQLAALMRDRPAKLNLIPFNPFPGTHYRRSSAEAIDRFRRTLLGAGVMATIRKTRGDDIDAACGQLAGRIKDRSLHRLGTKLVS